MHGHQGLDPSPGGPVDQLTRFDHAVVIDEGLDRGRRQIEGVGVDVAEHRPRPSPRDGAGCCKKGKRRGDDLIARAHFQCHQGEQQGIRAGRDADSGRSCAIVGYFLLEGAHVFTQDEMLPGAYFVDDRHHFCPNLGKLSLQIQQWHDCHAA